MSAKDGNPGLAPASFTIVMGTGAFAISTLNMAKDYAFLHLPACCLNVLNFLLFCFLVWRAARTWPRSADFMRADFDSPHQSAFYAAIGISLLVLGTQAMEFEMGREAALILWSLGCFLTFMTNFTLFLRFFLCPALRLEHFTPVFFIPVGGLAVIPVGGAAFMGCAHGTARDILLLVNALAAGAGLLLYFGLFSLLLQRHFLSYPLEDRLAPTVWIHMAPIGWSGVGVLALGQAVCAPNGLDMARLFACLLWGGAAWWLIMAGLLTLRAVLRRGMFFTFAWWAFIFPLGAITVLSFRLGGAFTAVFHVLWFLMAFLWLLCAARTALFVFNH